MSRCGSTLVANMLRARGDCVVLPEPPALDAMLRPPVPVQAADHADQHGRQRLHGELVHQGAPVLALAPVQPSPHHHGRRPEEEGGAQDHLDVALGRLGVAEQVQQGTSGPVR